ncbi:MmcQ/YjbR family DNA-binding protein [Actinomadura monticuli]|uniref:MmcQ/YjbR family DNA-binding protein n=1 Tax=Actinomadura monticuli TaxID=3097367 RepID=A0ABV4QHL6_9ACTN
MSDGPLTMPGRLVTRRGVQVSDVDAAMRIREICLSLPEATEKPFGGHTAPSFRVRDKLFVMTSEDGLSMTFKAGPGVQEALVAENPEGFFVPKYVGSKGWVGARLDVEHDWDEMSELIEDSYRLIAPKRLVNLLDRD